MPRSFSAAPRRETLLYRNQPLHYTLVFRSRRTIGFAVRPDGSVHISAPAGTSPEWVAQQVLRKADWILKHQETFARRPAPAPSRRYEAGSQHFYQGQAYALRFAEAPRPNVAVEGENLVLSSRAPLTEAQAEALLHTWYARQAGPLFAESLARVWPRFAEFNLTRPTLSVRQMRTRWGSCTPRTARIRLSPELVRARPECLDYVLLHECCHLLVGDHSKAFYDLQTRLLPDWERWKIELNALPK
ncbi:M48 family metallopeptidase [Hymenobacter properus]|uniref:M48 family metallopeptidase n=1 Tax=Hymenobacter properus TaxID=2791026 RepID=A0A931BH77_9BACT|nr:SprT family zinc-dependent metalloprotease [Hymenobacter properus]MBF9143509.1 M48 family metallopeptidase [Hymenobacter properus]MBR7722322.1 M48 family metallopeptidase [Microvirga sp. SRT04]